MDNKKLMRVAKVLSAIFMPLYAPLWVIVGLFVFTYLRLLPLSYMVFILCIVYVFTIGIPVMGISVVRMFKKWTHLELSHREHRHMPYVVTLLSYGACLVIMTKINTAMFFRGVVMAALISQVICVMVNAWWKISTHMVGMGGLVGALNAFSILFYYNPVFPMSMLILLSGILGTSRMLLRQHSLAQVLAGFAVGYMCAMTFILLSWL